MDDHETVRDLLSYLDASPSPFHACASSAERLDATGFTRLDETAPWTWHPRGYLVRGGTLIAWAGTHEGVLARPFRIVGAHTDSPNLRMKPRPDTGRVGFRQLGVEVYGGALLNSWLDRDLGLSGRVAVPGSDGPKVHLLRIDRPLLRIPQLAIHLDHDVNEKGLTLNRQQHLTPVWGLGDPVEGEFADFVAEAAGVPAVEAWDLMCHDLTPATVSGRDGEFLSSARIDNLASCWAATTSLIETAERRDQGPSPSTAVICLFDHEEVGSVSASGADSTTLPAVLERLVLASGGDREDLLRSLAASLCLSADGAHATHPNYAERHEPGHHVHIGAGPAIKHNVNARYATDAVGEAHVRGIAREAGVALQDFVSRSDIRCGSTIGPVTAARLGIPTVDVGIPQLAMHSARELCGTADPARFRDLLAAFLAG